MVLTVLLLALPASADPPARLLDLASPGAAAPSITRIHGSTGTGQYGVPVCGGFDCNGDGWRDVAFSQLVAGPLGRVNCGMVTLVFSDGTFGATIDTVGFTNRILKIIGDADHEITGSEVWMDDLDGDGLGDLLIGRQNFSPIPARAGAGALTIVFGSTNLTASAAALTYLDLRSPPTNVAIVTIVGEQSYDRLGIWMRTGDVDGDGQVDLVLGADEWEDEGRPLSENSGAAYVFRGGTHWGNWSGTVDLGRFGQADFRTELKGRVAMVLPPASVTDAHFGATCTIGDLDGNGRGEVLVAATINRAGASLRLPGAPFGTGEAFGGLGNGALFIAWDENFPDGLWPEGYQFRVDQAPLGACSRIDGSLVNGAFGEEILAGRDFSGDGFPDLFVGDLTGIGPNGFSSGLGYVIWNAAELRGRTFNISTPPAGLPVSTLYGPSQGAIGADTVTAGDFDRDGIDDLVVGNPHDSPQGRPNAGSVHVLFGQAGGWPGTIDLRSDATPGLGLPAAADLRITQIDAANGTVGANQPDTLCYSAAAGDLDGDGFVDLIANEMIGDGLGPGTVDVGNLLLISGRALAPPQLSPLGQLSGLLSLGSHSLDSDSLTTANAIITNSSAAAVMPGTIILEGPAAKSFSIEADTGETLLQPGAFRMITVRLRRESVGPKGAALKVAASGLPLRFSLSGQVFDPGLRPNVTVTAVSDGADYLGFASQAGLRFEFQRSTNLNHWIPIRTNLIGTGGQIWIPQPTRRAPEFFRVLGRP